MTREEVMKKFKVGDFVRSGEWPPQYVEIVVAVTKYGLHTEDNPQGFFRDWDEVRDENLYTTEIDPTSFRKSTKRERTPWEKYKWIVEEGFVDVCLLPEDTKNVYVEAGFSPFVTQYRYLVQRSGQPPKWEDCLEVPEVEE